MALLGALAGFIIFDRKDRIRVLAVIDDKKKELIEMISAIQESHNSLNETHKAIDAKVTELGLRLSQMNAPQARAQKPFPGF